MGYDAFARLLVGIPVTRDQFFVEEEVRIIACDNGHAFEEDLPDFAPPKFCPECGTPVRPKKTVKKPTPVLAAWLVRTVGMEAPKMSADDIWCLLKNGIEAGVFPADNRVNSEQEPQSWAFGMPVMRDVGPESGIVPFHGLTPEELAKIMDWVKTSAAFVGISGEPRIFVQLRESF